MTRPGFHRTFLVFFLFKFNELYYFTINKWMFFDAMKTIFWNIYQMERLLQFEMNFTSWYAVVIAHPLPPPTSRGTVRVTSPPSWHHRPETRNKGKECWQLADTVVEGVIDEELHGWFTVGSCMWSIDLRVLMLNTRDRQTDGRTMSEWASWLLDWLFDASAALSWLLVNITTVCSLLRQHWSARDTNILIIVYNYF